MDARQAPRRNLQGRLDPSYLENRMTGQQPDSSSGLIVQQALGHFLEPLQDARPASVDRGECHT